MQIDIDAAKQTFIVEALELLQDMEQALLAIEESPDDEDAINAIFRAAHTIKGSAGIVGFENIEQFTHKVENLLEKARLREIPINSELIDLLLKCRDHIAGLVQSASDSASDRIAPSQDTLDTEESLTNKLNAYLKPAGLKSNEDAEKTDTQQADAVTIEESCSAVKSDNYHISLRFAPNVLRDGMDPISFINYLTRLGEITSITTITDAMPPASEMNPEDCYLGFEIDFKSDFDKKTIEDVFEFVREDAHIRILTPKSSIESYVKLIDELPEDPSKIGEILVKGGALTPAELEEALRLQSGKTEPRPRLGDILVNEGMVPKEVVDAALEKQKSARDTKAKEAKTIRVDAEKLDYLITMVGELVISGATLQQHARRINDSGLQESTSIMSRLVEDIREAAMKVRMVPIGETFSRFHRVIRDISKEMGKEIELIISGAETELDKTVVEKISDPLMHIVRNAADHGIERADERIALGKPPKGTIRLNAYQDSGSIVIEVSDDGRGIDREKVLKKAVERGLISQSIGHGQNLSDREIYNLIFEPGFSTAEQVTKLSGRGVGMDVVKRNVEALRGTVEIESDKGTGTTVRIRLPLTLAIIDGFMVKVGNSFYVIPLDMVMECLEVPEQGSHSSDIRRYINLRGHVLPYVRLRDLFNENGQRPKYENIVVVRHAGQTIGLMVDELHGEVQAVIKPLGKMYRNVEGISGATILGDGTVALIMDVPHIVQRTEKRIEP